MPCTSTVMVCGYVPTSFVILVSSSFVKIVSSMILPFGLLTINCSINPFLVPYYTAYKNECQLFLLENSNIFISTLDTNDDNLNDIAWYGDIQGTRSRPYEVGTLNPNNFGLYDMHGNVEEWCNDRWNDGLSHIDLIDPVGPETGTYRVLRGGCWNSYPYKLSNKHNRSYCEPTMGGGGHGSAGFRVALVPIDQ